MHGHASCKPRSDARIHRGCALQIRRGDQGGQGPWHANAAQDCDQASSGTEPLREPMQMLQIAVRAALDAARSWMNVMNARHGARNFMPNTFSTDEGMHDFSPP